MRLTTQPAVIVLAAGKGSRYSSSPHKLMQPFGNDSVLGSTLRHAVASRLPVVVVTTAALAGLARRTVAARDVVVLPEVGDAAHPFLGMGHSIAAGVSASPDAAGWIVLPGDMPLVRASTLQAVARELGHHAVVYAQHKGHRGHPVGFATELFSELATLSGDEGARRLVARYPALALEVDDPGVLADIDTEADLFALREAADREAVAASGAVAETANEPSSING